MGPRSPDHEHVAVYDYGMGGIWMLITGDSRQAVERRFPWLRVVDVGDPPWITREKYREIVETWIPENMRFDASRPDGWLAETDARLGISGTNPDRRPRLESDPPAAGRMRYQLVSWQHDSTEDPVVLYAEIDSDGFENRKVDEFRDGRLARADRNGGMGSTFVSAHFTPDIDAINQEPCFGAVEISADEFEQIWARAAPNDA